MSDVSLAPATSRMTAFEIYVSEIEALARDALAGRTKIGSDEPSLNGAAGTALRLSVARAVRRSAGAFFTTSAIREGGFEAALPQRPARLGALDPACGGGDLLLQWSRRLPVRATMRETIHEWGGLLRGVDIHSEFVRLTRARLVLAAASRCGRTSGDVELEACFPQVVVKDGLEELRAGEIAPWTLMNPPFVARSAPADYRFGSGSVSAAAVFLAAWLDSAPAGSKIVAVMPEVLRTGSRYQRWRSAVAESCGDILLSSLGQFDEDTDVDVFVLAATKRATSAGTVEWWPPPPKLNPEAKFSVAAGTVVPHRDPQTGPVVPFLLASNLPHRTVAPSPSETRCYDGRLFEPPFIAVRRTSRPGQWPRARATVVTGDAPMAVENHLIVLQPTSRSFEACARLVSELHSSAVSTWLDSRLGGRHLTTEALVELLRTDS